MKMTVKALLVASAVLTIVYPATAFAHEIKLKKPESVGMSSERLEGIGQSMQRLIDESKIPGTVTLVARRGKVVHFEARGMRNVADQLPMETDTIFRLYSQTKPVTGVAVMMLFEEGHFLLSDPISKYLPEFANMQVYVGQKDGKPVLEPAKPITIHQLLTHTSGLTYFFFGTPVGMMYLQNGIAGSMSEYPTQESLEDLVKDLAKLPLIAQPGTEWNYGMSIDVLGRLVEVVSGQSFGDFLHTRIFEPLEMHDTGFFVPDDKASRFANNYQRSPDGNMALLDDASAKSAFRKPPAIEFGGGGLVGTVDDYFHFAQMLADKGEFGGKRLLGQKTVEFMMSNHLRPDMGADPLSSLLDFSGQGGAWGMGFGIAGSVTTNAALSGMPGSMGAYSWGGSATTHFWVDLEEELVGLVHTQLLPDGTYPVRELMQLHTYQAIID